VSNSECVSTIVATLGSDIYLVIIFGFSSFNFYHIYFLRSSVIFNNGGLPRCTIGNPKYLGGPRGLGGSKPPPP
jgi:hypothetical protein